MYAKFVKNWVREVPPPQIRERQKWMGDAFLDRDERNEQRGRQRDATEHERTRPPVLRSSVDRE